MSTAEQNAAEVGHQDFWRCVGEQSWESAYIRVLFKLRVLQGNCFNLPTPGTWDNW